MKKFLLYTVSLLAIASSMSSCKNEQDLIFDGSAADRLIAACTDTKELLCSKPNGWVMQYFTIDEAQGYLFLMDFNKAGYVKIGAKHHVINNVYTEETSTYDMVSDNGPVLSLSSYNTIFHCFATPEDAPETSDNEAGYGRKGDYEFIIMDVTDDRIVLRGKKWGYEAILTPLPEGQDWEGYFTAMEERQNKFFSKSIPLFELTTDNGVYYLTHANYGYFFTVKETEDPVSDTDFIPYVVNTEGMRFGRPFVGGVTEKNTGLKLKDFVEREDGRLECIDEGQHAVISAPAVERLLTETFTVMTPAGDKPVITHEAVRFQAVPADLNEPMAEAVTTLGAAIKKYNSRQQIRYIYWQFNQAAEKVQLTIKTTNYSLIYNLGATVNEDGSVSLTNGDEPYDKNSTTFYDKVPAIKTFVDEFCSSPIKAELDNPLQATKATFTFGNGWGCVMTL